MTSVITKKQTEVNALKSIANQFQKIQSVFREIHALPKGASPLSLCRGILGDTEQMMVTINELAAHHAANSNNAERDGEEWKDAKLGACEVMVLCGLMINISIACISIRNRSVHHSHVPLLILSFALAVNFSFYPY